MLVVDVVISWSRLRADKAASPNITSASFLLVGLLNPCDQRRHIGALPKRHEVGCNSL